ncbi:uncharacterized protein TNIN_492861 [Trichonephila inaurata madagascariensis]|uniref:Uncharacterized protein n=1 Tax=Trichonephila inaurata madagascariensis TaxID=2747483 RepID=A0A8X7CNE8_9ARAC|nr:uncharacterized protein TNIN_492861 [Trichonephila inaurata madagascariensis]
MVVYQKLGVIGSSLVFAALQKLKFQIFRIFIIYDTCRRNSSCDNSTAELNSTDAYFNNAVVSDFLFKSLLVNNVVAILPCIFLAAWSDKHGRKLLLLLPFVGSFIGDILMLVLLYVPIASKNLLLLSEGIHGFCGGTVLIGLGCLCYVTDSTDHRLRTWFIGLFFGLYNFLPLIEMTLQYYWTPLIFVLGSYQGNPWMNLLTPINVSDTVSCVFKRRMDNMRFFIISLCTVFVFYNLLLHGNLTVFPQYFWNVFHWPYKDVILFAAVHAISQTLTLWICSYSALKCRILDIETGIYGTCSLAASCLALTFLRNSWIVVMAALVGAASLLIPTSIVSVLSKLIERVETGSMYAGVGFLMLVTQLISIPSYEALYKVCVEADIPQVVFLLSLGFATYGLLFFIYLKKNIAPDLLGHLNASESLALISRKGEIEQLFD